MQPPGSVNGVEIDCIAFVMGIVQELAMKLVQDKIIGTIVRGSNGF